MTEAETWHAQIATELLAATFACCKFHDYIYGLRVTIEIDRKPLITLFKKPFLAVSAPDVQPRVHLQEQKIAVYSGHPVTRLHRHATSFTDPKEETPTTEGITSVPSHCSTTTGPQEVVRLQTHKGHDRLDSQHLMAYMVRIWGKEYHRNRRHLLAVYESPPEANPTDQDPSTTPVDRGRLPSTPVRALSPISPAQFNSPSISQSTTQRTQHALATFPQTLLIWLRYVDDTFTTVH